MSGEGLPWKRLASAVVGLVLVLGVLAWLDKPECLNDATAEEAPRRHVALVVDRSGSMEFLVREVVDNINSVIDALRPTDRISILFFEDPYGVVPYVENQAVDQVQRLSYDDYYPLGGTPLYDAVGIAINEVMTPTIGAGKLSEFGLIIILSDGEENASVRYSLSDVRQAVAAALSNRIDIRFYGLGVAAAGEAAALGIPLEKILQVDQTAAGLTEAFEDLQQGLTQARVGQC